MMRNFLATVLALMFFGSLASAGVWTYVRSFPNDTIKFQVHGLTVDKGGKVWIQVYGVVPGDSVFDGGKNRGVRKVRIMNPDGTPSSIDKLWSITVGGVTDTMYNSQVGMRTDPDGNVILCSFDKMYRVNYQTGAGMNGPVQPVVGQTLCAPAVDAAGDIFTSNVFPGYRLGIYDAGFNDAGNALDTIFNNFGRSLNVSADGSTIYLTRYSAPYLLIFHSDNGTFGPYVQTDSLLYGMSIESSAWNPRTGLLYLASGGQSPSLPPYSNEVWYGWNTTTKTIVDSIVWNQTVSPGDCRPRAIAFSPGGDTAYGAQFGNSGIPSVQMFVWGPGAVEPINNVIPSSYTLFQNYPNPFNPTTNIEFSVPTGGNTTLKVYDVLGHEVATLVNERLAPGTYKATLDASKLSSGTYIYSLISGSTRITKKMMLLK